MDKEKIIIFIGGAIVFLLIMAVAVLVESTILYYLVNWTVPSTITFKMSVGIMVLVNFLSAILRRG
jgi:hypothetical protein